MSEPEVSAPPSLVVSAGGVTARLKPGALLWESESAVSRIPYGAIVSVTVEPGTRRGRSAVRIAAGDQAPVFELVCRRQEASLLAAAIEQQVAAVASTLPADRPVVTTEPRTAEPSQEPTVGRHWPKLVFYGLLGLCVAEAVALLLLGRPARSAIGLFSFVLWVPGLVLAWCVVRLGSELLRAMGPGVKVEAQFVGIEWRPASNGMHRHQVYTVTGLDGAAREYTRVTATYSTAEARPVRTVTALTDGSEIDTRLSMVAGPLVLGPICLAGSVGLIGLGFAAMPGLLLWQLFH